MSTDITQLAQQGQQDLTESDSCQRSLALISNKAIDCCTLLVHRGCMVTERNRRLSMLISDDEWEMLQALADRDGLNVSDHIRLYIRRAHAELASSNAKPPPPKRRKR